MNTVWINIVLAIGVFVFGVYIASRTSFGRRPIDPGPFWIHTMFEVPIFILPGTVLTSFEVVRELWIFRNVDDTSYLVAVGAMYYGLLAYFGTILVADKLLCKTILISRAPRGGNPGLLAILILSLQLVMIAGLLAFVSEIPLIGLFTGGDIGVLRKAATIEFNGPVVLLTLIKLYGLLGVFLLAATRSTLRSPLIRGLLWTISLICLSWSGEKSPAVIALLGYWFLSANQEHRRISLKNIGLIALPFTIAAFGFYYLVIGNDSIQNVAWLFGVRAFLGQISGYFQTISNVTPDIKYVWSWVPFGGLISDNVSTFSRDLMLMTEGDTATSGTLNSLFLAEAYGVGGWPMLLISPFIVATSIMISLHILRRWLTQQIGSDFATCGTYLFLMNAWLTSGMSGFPAFRSLIVVGFVLASIVIPYRLLRSNGHLGSRRISSSVPI